MAQRIQGRVLTRGVEMQMGLRKNRNRQLEWLRDALGPQVRLCPSVFFSHAEQVRLRDRAQNHPPHTPPGPQMGAPAPRREAFPLLGNRQAHRIWERDYE